MTKSITINFAIVAIVAAAMILATAVPAFAAVNSSSITVSTTNQGSISNNTQSEAHSGLNLAFGSIGGAGARGGDVTSAGDNNNGGARSGNGGNGGNGGAGGLVQTGNATSNAGSENGLNGTDVDVDITGANGDVNSTAVAVTTDNDDEDNVIENNTQARGRTGENLALGSAGGAGARGGEIDGGAGDFNNGGATSGTGGAGGSGGLGGTVATGNASSTAGAVNLLNTTIVRVRL